MLIHGVSLGTDPPSKPQPSNFFLSSQALKNLTSPPRQKTSTDHSNTLHMFNKNTYTDFRTAHKNILTPTYVIQVRQQNQNITKLNINWLFD